MPGMVLPLTPGMAGASPAGAGGGGPQQIVITFEGGPSAMLNQLQKSIQAKGGNVQAVLGSN
jgi:hypothetical protein